MEKVAMVALEEDMEMKHPTHYKEIMVDNLLLIMDVTLLRDNQAKLVEQVEILIILGMVVYQEKQLQVQVIV